MYKLKCFRSTSNLIISLLPSIILQSGSQHRVNRGTQQYRSGLVKFINSSTCVLVLVHIIQHSNYITALQDYPNIYCAWQQRLCDHHCPLWAPERLRYQIIFCVACTSSLSPRVKSGIETLAFNGLVLIP